MPDLPTDSTAAAASAPASNQTQGQSPAIELRGVTLRRGGRTLLDAIDWRVPAGSCCAVLGPNGAGKSTLLAVTEGYLWPQEGEVRVLGERYGAVDLRALRRRLGVLGHSRLPEFHADETALDTVLAGLWGAIVLPPGAEPTPGQTAEARRELELVGLAGREDADFGALSSGEQMRVMLARAIVSRPELLIMDEPTSALDMAGRARFTRALDRLLAARPGMSLVIVTHMVEDLPRATSQVLLLREGRAVAAGPIAQALTAATLSRAYDCAIELHHEDGQFWTRVPLPAEEASSRESWSLR